MLFDPRQDQVSRDILAAAQYIRDHGWCQERLFDVGGRVCVRGALYAVIGGTVDYIRDFTDDENARVLAANNRLEEYLSLEGRGETELSILPDWNDEAGRTKEEVIRAMCGAAGVTEDILV